MQSGETCLDRKSLSFLCSCYDSNVDVGSSLPERKKVSSIEIGLDFSRDESWPLSGRWFSAVPVHRASATQAGRGGQLYIYLPLSTRCTNLSKEKIVI